MVQLTIAVAAPLFLLTRPGAMGYLKLFSCAFIEEPFKKRRLSV